MIEAEMRQHHIDMWDWLVDNPDKKKADWPGWNNIDIRPPAFCFACYTAQVRGERSQGHYIGYPSYCQYCPLDLERQCSNVDSPFWQWADGVHVRSNALAIRDAWPEVPNE